MGETTGSHKVMAIMMSETEEHDEARNRFDKRIGIAKVVIGSLVAIFMGGFMVSEYFGGFARTTKVESALTQAAATHEEKHAAVNERIKALEERTTEIRIEQAKSRVNERLMGARLELIVELQNRGTSRSEVRRIEDRIRTLQAEAEVIEEDPTAGLDLMRRHPP